MRNALIYLWIVFVSVISLSCTPTYKANHLEESVKDILKKEYAITTAEVRVIGKTLGVFLPLEQLFSANLNSLASMKEGEDIDPESLFQFHPDAMDKVEDVLFTTSRVILSTNQPIDFYVLKAVETGSTGIELDMTGYVLDMKRVRYWDIPISEYRKRVLHDLTVNRTILWKRTIEDFFQHMGSTETSALITRYFVPGISQKEMSPFFYAHLLEEEHKENLQFDILSVRTKQINDSSVLVYVQVKETFAPKQGYEGYDFLFESGSTHEFLFILQSQRLSYKIRQVIPFYFIDENKTVRPIEFPPELKIYDSIDSWSEVFQLDEVFLGPFLAKQLTKRMQALIAQDVRIIEQCEKASVEVLFQESTEDNPLASFFLRYELQPRLSDSTEGAEGKTELPREEYEYIMNVFLEECVTVMRAYQFTDFDGIELYNEESQSSMFLKKEIITNKKIKKNDMLRFLEMHS